MASAAAGPTRAPAHPRPRGDAQPRWERRLGRCGYRAVAGLDEAGRGCWAGPLVAAAVVLPSITPGVLRSLAGLRDSKQLPAAERERLFCAIHEVAVGIGLGVVSATSIDLLGLTAAGHLAMERASRSLPISPDFLLVDAFRLPTAECPQEAIVYGDVLCLSIAAASVAAKVERDRLLTKLGAVYPGFGFERNRGYGTAEHARALATLGPTPEHRCSYAPVRAVIESEVAS